MQKASLGPTRSPGRGPDLPYSSRIILSTLRTMLPTVVSEGCAVVILRPSLRISSISSPAVRGREKGREGAEQARGGTRATRYRERRVAGRGRIRSALPALLQRWSVMIRRSSPSVSRAMSSELRRPPPRFRASTKLSILSDNCEPLAAAPGISKEGALTAESTPAPPPGLHFRGGQGRLPLCVTTPVGDVQPRSLPPSAPSICLSQSETWNSCCAAAESPRLSRLLGRRGGDS